MKAIRQTCLNWEWKGIGSLSGPMGIAEHDINVYLEKEKISQAI
jgi:hypothetical protein